MSISSSDSTSAQTSIATSMITSQGGSGSESDIIKNVAVISIRAMGNVQKRSNRGFFSPDFLVKLKRPRGQLKPDEVIASSLYPFA